MGSGYMAAVHCVHASRPGVAAEPLRVYVAMCVSQHWYLSVQTALADRAVQVQWSRSQGHLKAPLLQPDEVSVERWIGPVAVILLLLLVRCFVPPLEQSVSTPPTGVTLLTSA